MPGNRRRPVTSIGISFRRRRVVDACIAFGLKCLLGIGAIPNNFQIESIGGSADTKRNFLTGFIAWLVCVTPYFWDIRVFGWVLIEVGHGCRKSLASGYSRSGVRVIC